jgi:hypothetical protein
VFPSESCWQHIDDHAVTLILGHFGRVGNEVGGCLQISGWVDKEVGDTNGQKWSAL